MWGLRTALPLSELELSLLQIPARKINTTLTKSSQNVDGLGVKSSPKQGVQSVSPIFSQRNGVFYEERIKVCC